MKALVISGGGSKGTFAGGVAEHLIRVQGRKYDLYLGSSTGSLLVSHLAFNKIEKIKIGFTEVSQESIFVNCPFTIKSINGVQTDMLICHCINGFKRMKFIKSCG